MKWDVSKLLPICRMDSLIWTVISKTGPYRPRTRDSPGWVGRVENRNKEAEGLSH